MVTGPMGATIAHLAQIGWYPVSPYRWADHQGNTWQYTGESSLAPLLEAIQKGAEQAVLRNAALHPGGDGLQGGIDLTVIHRHKKSLKKQERHADAGTLDTVLSGGNLDQTEAA